MLNIKISQQKVLFCKLKKNLMSYLLFFKIIYFNYIKNNKKHKTKS